MLNGLCVGVGVVVVCFIVLSGVVVSVCVVLLVCGVLLYCGSGGVCSVFCSLGLSVVVFFGDIVDGVVVVLVLNMEVLEVVGFFCVGDVVGVVFLEELVGCLMVR